MRGGVLRKQSWSSEFFLNSGGDLEFCPPDPQAPWYGRKLATNLQLNITTPLLVWVFPWDPFLTYLA